jgi:hypothetical protein
MMRQAKARKVTNIVGTSLQRSGHNAEPFGTSASCQEVLVCPLAFKVCGNNSREEVNNGVSQVPVLIWIPRAIEEVKCSSYTFRQVFEE